jgi:type II secretory pathway pseudopilin PulG
MDTVSSHRQRFADEGFGLIQIILLVIVIGLAVTAAFQVATYSMDEARRQDTIAEMNRISIAIAGNSHLYANGARLDFGYVGDIGSLPVSLADLVTNPGYASWNGPYLSVEYSNYADDYLYDAWGEAYELSGTELRAFGLAGDTIRVKIADNLAQLIGNTVAGSVTNELGDPPGTQASSIQVVLTYPGAFGTLLDSTITPATDGSFSFTGFVPCGNHRLMAIFTTTSDTSETIVSVLPGSSMNVVLRLGSLAVAAAAQPRGFYITRHYSSGEVGTKT